MGKYYSVTFKRGLYTYAYSDSKEKCEEYVRKNKTINFNGKTYKLAVKEISESSYILCGVNGIKFIR